MRSCDNVKISSSAVRRGLSRNHGAAWISSAPVSEAPARSIKIISLNVTGF